MKNQIFHIDIKNIIIEKSKDFKILSFT